jgi:acyl dehydratase
VQRLEIDVPVARELAHVYSECAQIWNPIHTEQRVARAVGLRGTILHGTASWALAAREIVAQVGSGDHRRLKCHGGRFAAMVVPGTTLKLRLAVSRHGDSQRVHFSLLTPEGRPAITDGFAEISDTP